MTTRTTFVITVVTTPGTDGIRALRWVLKRLLRGYGLRCIDIVERSS